MTALAQLDPNQAGIVELRFFGGLSVEEVPVFLGVSERTVVRQWGLAKAWLAGELGWIDGDGRWWIWSAPFRS